MSNENKLVYKTPSYQRRANENYIKRLKEKGDYDADRKAYNAEYRERNKEALSLKAKARYQAKKQKALKK